MQRKILRRGASGCTIFQDVSHLFDEFDILPWRVTGPSRISEHAGDFSFCWVLCFVLRVAHSGISQDPKGMFSKTQEVGNFDAEGWETISFSIVLVMNGGRKTGRKIAEMRYLTISCQAHLPLGLQSTQR